MKSLQVEEWFGSERIDFDYRIISLEEINVKKSLSNQARLGSPLTPAVVDAYAAAMDGGDEMPAIVVYHTQKGYIVIDGNHRVAAANIVNGVHAIDAYVAIVENQRQVNRLTRSANTKLVGALGAPQEDSVEHAKHFCRMGMSISEAALLMGVSANSVSESLRDDKTRIRLDKLDVLGRERLNKTTRLKLNVLKNDLVFKEAAKLTIGAKMSSLDAQELVRKVNACTTEKEQLAMVKMWSQQPGIARKMAGKKVRSEPTARRRFFNHITWLRTKLDDNPSPSDLEITNEKDLSTLEEVVALLHQLMRNARSEMGVIK